MPKKTNSRRKLSGTNARESRLRCRARLLCPGTKSSALRRSGHGRTPANSSPDSASVQGPAVFAGARPQPDHAATADPQSPGNINGTIVDPSGAAVAGARVALTRNDKSPKQEVLSGDDGQLSFAGVPPGPFQITVTSELFTTQEVSAILHPGETLVLPQITFALATEVSQVQVSVPRIEIAEEELKVEEKQRIFGVIPNFYVSYVPNAAPLALQTKISARLAQHH